MNIINSDLERSILKNFEFFNHSFNNFDEMKDDMKEVASKARSIKDAQKNLKKSQLINMVKVYQLQRKKMNLIKISETLRYITVLQ